MTKTLQVELFVLFHTQHEVESQHFTKVHDKHAHDKLTGPVDQWCYLLSLSHVTQG